MSKKLWDDYNFVLNAVRKNGLNLKNASKRLKRNKSIVQAAVKQNCGAIVFAHSRALDKEVHRATALRAVKRNPAVFTDMCQKLKDTKEIALEACRFRPSDCSQEIRMTNIAQVGKTLLADKTFIEEISEFPLWLIRTIDRFNVFQFADEKLQNDRLFVLRLIEKDRLFLSQTNETMREDYEIVLAAVKKRGMSWTDASARLKENYEIAKAAIFEDGNVIRYMPDVFKNDRVLALSAAKTQKFSPFQQNILAVLNDDMRSDEEICCAALLTDWREAIPLVSEKLAGNFFFIHFTMLKVCEVYDCMHRGYVWQEMNWRMPFYRKMATVWETWNDIPAKAEEMFIAISPRAKHVRSHAPLFVHQWLPSERMETIFALIKMKAPKWSRTG